MAQLRGASSGGVKPTLICGGVCLGAGALASAGQLFVAPLLSPGGARPVAKHPGEETWRSPELPSAALPPAAANAILGVGVALLGLHAVADRRRAIVRRAKKAGKATPAPKAKGPPPFDPAGEIGALPPLGFFDPLGFSPVGEKGKFRRLREAELKHGRVAMMASLGLVGEHYVKFPGFESLPASGAACFQSPGDVGWLALVATCGIIELTLGSQDMKKEPGDFGDPLGLKQYTTEMRNKEINNGRFAMLAAMGIIVANLTTGKDAVEQLGVVQLPF
mmetsp:Transcript_69555/g.193532  ORF Transcript_69555/g.193532 Transcript_69555/m.193532 type:complete len:277 (-) Transcript_69555:65-895(-)